jgi:signal transduction histidine kinase
MSAIPAAKIKNPLAIVNLVLIGVIGIRVLILYANEPIFLAAAGLLASFCLLYAAGAYLLRVSWLRWIYFPLIAAIVLAGMLLQPHLDMWGMLYYLTGQQAVLSLSRRSAALFLSVIFLLFLAAQIYALGWADGLAVSLQMTAGGIFLISFLIIYLGVEQARQNSQALLADLQTANSRLKEYTEEAEALSAAQERNRLARELHDSVSQILFSVNLTAQSAQILLKTNPAYAGEQLERVQELTSIALGRLRSLITQLRPK